MPLLTCSSLLLFYSLLLSQLFLNVCVHLLLSVQTILSTKDGLCECILNWVPRSLNFCIFFLTGSSSIVVLCWPFQLQISLCALPFLYCSVPVLQLWPLLCDLYDISDSAHLFFLYFDCLQFISLPCVSCVHAFSLLTPKMGARLLNVYSNVLHQWCRARWTECNHMLYVFIRLWLPLFLLPVSFSISLCLCYSTLLYEKLLWMPFFPPGCPFF